MESKSGSFTANFKEVSPPIPQEYLIGLYTLTATVFTGWFVPNAARWVNSGLQRKHMLNFLLELEKQEDAKKNLENLKTKITYAYAKGKINELHYKLLKDKIESYTSIDRDKTNSGVPANNQINKKSPILSI